jgi:hypothetical protein
VSDEDVADAAPPDEAGIAVPRRSRWRSVLVFFAVLLALGAAVGVGLVIGRALAPNSTSAAIEPDVEESPVVEKLPQGNSPNPESTVTASADAGNVTVLVAAATSSSGSVFLTGTDGLPDTPTTASGYRLVNAGISGGQVAAVLASVFGVPGQPVTQEDRWVVGTPDGPAASLTVTNDPLFRWVYDAGSAPLAAAGPPMTADRAVELTSAVLGSIGVDTASVDWQVDLHDGVTLVTAWQVVAGARTQLSWQIGFGPTGELVRAAGFSAGFEEVPGYPVVGAATAVDRAGRPPWSAIGPAAVSSPPPDAGPTPAASDATPAAGERPTLTVPATYVNVTGADLALAQYWQPDGGMLVLPSYLLTGEDGSRWSLLAVDDSAVAFVEPPYPSADPGSP